VLEDLAQEAVPFNVEGDVRINKERIFAEQQLKTLTKSAIKAMDGEQQDSTVVDVESNKKKEITSNFAEDAMALYIDLDALFGQERVNHGDPDEAFEWKWPSEAALPALQLSLPDSSVNLMAHYVWQSSISMAEEIVQGRISVQGKGVLELGSGAALPSLVARRMGAEFVCASDYPEDRIVANMQKNMEGNALQEVDCEMQVLGYKWGDPVDLVLNAFPERRVDLILLADTLWMEEQHESLLICCREIMRASTSVAPKAILTFMNHDNGQGVSKRFFERAFKEFNFIVEEDRVIDWRKSGKESECESDSDDPDKYGPVYFRMLALQDEAH